MSAGGGVVLVPYTSTGYKIGTTLSIGVTGTQSLTIRGEGAAYVAINYSGTGALFSIPGAAAPNRKAYVNFENLVLTPTVRRASGTLGISYAYTDVFTLRNVRIRQFETGLKLDNSTGCKLYNVVLYDNVTGLQISAGSGGFGMYGGEFDNNQLGFLIDGVTNGITFVGTQCDTDPDATNGANSQGAGKITAAANDVNFDGSVWYAEATPVAGTGATILLDGGCTNIVFNNNHFNGQLFGSASQAAVKIVSATRVKFIGGKTINHSASSLIVNTGAANVFVLDMENNEATFSTGTAVAVPARIMLENTGMILAGDGSATGSSLRFNNSTNASFQRIIYSGGLVVGEASKNLGFYGVTPVARASGWTAATGTATRTTFVTSTVTLSVLAEHVKALIDDLLANGLIGP